MYRLIFNAFLLAILSLALAAKAADTQNCAEIVDDAKRLHCYDQMVAEAGTDADSVGTPVGIADFRQFLKEFREQPDALLICPLKVIDK